jgi:hypothetical protein
LRPPFPTSFPARLSSGRRNRWLRCYRPERRCPARSCPVRWIVHTPSPSRWRARPRSNSSTFHACRSPDARSEGMPCPTPRSAQGRDGCTQCACRVAHAEVAGGDRARAAWSANPPRVPCKNVRQ